MFTRQKLKPRLTRRQIINLAGLRVGSKYDDDHENFMDEAFYKREGVRFLKQAFWVLVLAGIAMSVVHHFGYI